MMPHIHKRKSDGVWTCGRCGWVIDDQEKPQKATCPVCPTLSEQRNPLMLGDLVEKALTSVGITKPLIEKLTRTEGTPGGCGCDRRKKWLNEVGVMAQEKASNALAKVSEFYFGSPR